MAQARRTGEKRADHLWGTLSRARTAGLVGALVLAVMAVVVLICTVVGFAGSALVESGLIPYERLVSVSSVVTVMFAGSVVIAVIVALGVNRTLVSPLRIFTPTSSWRASTPPRPSSRVPR